MKIGIIVHSHTGNTLRVAEKIKDILVSKGKDAVVLRVSAEKEGKDRKHIKLIEKPLTDAFDVILFGAPVWAFSVSPIMREYLTHIQSLDGKKVCCFVTQSGTPFFGGNRAIKQMTDFCKAKGAKASLTEIICSKGEGLDLRIASAAEKLSVIGG